MPIKVEEGRHGETARQYACRTLRENIISLGLEPGAPFSDVEMSQMIGISRTPVQEAIIQLSEESRIIEIFPQGGVHITLIDVDLVEEVRFLRLVLGKAAVELVCGQTDEEDLQWLDESVRLQEFYLEGGSSWKPLGLGNEIHRKLFSIYRKELTCEISQRLTIHYNRIRSLSVAVVEDRKIIEDHKKLLETIRSRDKKLTAETMDLHLSRWMLSGQMFGGRYPTYLK